MAKSLSVYGRGHLSTGAWQLLNPAASRCVLQGETHVPGGVTSAVALSPKAAEDAPH